MTTVKWDGEQWDGREVDRRTDGGNAGKYGFDWNNLIERFWPALFVDGVAVAVVGCIAN